MNLKKLNLGTVIISMRHSFNEPLLILPCSSVWNVNAFIKNKKKVARIN